MSNYWSWAKYSQLSIQFYMVHDVKFFFFFYIFKWLEKQLFWGMWKLHVIHIIWNSKVLLKHSHAHLFTYYLWLLLCYDVRVGIVTLPVKPKMTSLCLWRWKHLPTMQKTQVWSLNWEDPLEKKIATHSSTLTWKIPWLEEPVGLHFMGSQRVGHDWETSLQSPKYLLMKEFCLVLL